jgi:aminoglycoside 6'-N-acetyltransferase I
MRIVPADKTHLKDWLKMRLLLWPECLASDSQKEIGETLSSDRTTAFIALDGDRVVGFAEVSTRDYVEGCTTRPVGYLEGIYVHSDFRKKGIARALVRTAESWSRSKGCEEFGSDTRVDDNASISFHKSIGFRETDRQVVFLKTIGD